MNKHIITAIALLGCTLIYSCKDTDRQYNDANNVLMRDSVFKVYPQIRQFRIEITDDNDVLILAGSKEFFNATPEKQREVADALAHIAYHFHNEHNYLDKGKVSFVAVENQMPTEQEPKKELDITLKN